MALLKMKMVMLIVMEAVHTFLKLIKNTGNPKILLLNGKLTQPNVISGQNLNHITGKLIYQKLMSPKHKNQNR